ncbi:MAG: VOC family protein [Chloroflexota bacterium]|nr:VOC family protein [Chloroflexota bacterium]
MKFAATLPASDIQRAKAWYSAVLHLEPTEITESGDVWYEIDGTSLMLYPSQFAGTNQATAVNIRVDDVEVSVAELKARGAMFETYDFGDAFRTVDGIATSAAGEKMAWLKDPEGNLISIGAR